MKTYQSHHMMTIPLWKRLSHNTCKDKPLKALLAWNKPYPQELHE